MNLGAWMQSARSRLADAGVESFGLEVRAIAAHFLRVQPTWLITHPDASIPLRSLEEAINRRLNGEPLAYVLGFREFYGRRFAVDARVLIPRPETELVVEVALETLPADSWVLDVGTGSGCIGLTLACERKDWTVTCVDSSTEALALAQANADSLGVLGRFLESDLFSAVQGETFAGIVTNPPYVGTHDTLGPGVSEFEPHSALFAGDDGLDVYRRLASEGMTYAPVLITEIGFGQKQSVAALFEAAGWRLDDVRHDLAGIERVLTFRA